MHRIEPLLNHPKYEKVEDLDRGAFGWVQRARNKLTGEEVAIKFLQLGPRFHERFVAREILNHRRLFHPHIVAFKEVFVTPQYLAIVMEYVGGGNLQQYVERAGRLPEWLARCFFQQLILALQYLHQTVNIAHRDIKLGNILLNTKYRIPILKICDFGYSKNILAGSTPKTRVGTAAYISPEVAQSRGEKAYDTEKADVWSCGVTLYCMLAGRYPFMDADHQIRLRRIQDLTPADVDAVCQSLTNVSPACRSLLHRILVVDSEQRATFADIMADSWFQLYLPNLGDMSLSPPGGVQNEQEVLACLDEAQRLCALIMKEEAEGNEALGAVIDDVFLEVDPSQISAMNLA